MNGNNTINNQPNNMNSYNQPVQNNTINNQPNNMNSYNQPVQNNTVNNQPNNMNSYNQPVQNNTINNQPNLEQLLKNNSNNNVNKTEQKPDFSNNSGKKSKLPIILLILVLVIGLVVGAIFLLPKDDNNDGKDTQLTKPPKDYISINTIEDYEKLINGTYDLTKNYILMSDLDLKDHCKQNICKPIGLDTEKGFTGKFNGNNHTISNYYYEITELDARDIGLFSKINNGTIENLKLENSEIVIKNTTNIDYNSIIGVGLLAGGATDSIIKNCNVTGKIINENIIEKIVYDVGLLLGYSSISKTSERIEVSTITNPYYDEINVHAKIEDCSAKGEINLKGTNQIESIGGLIGGIGAPYHKEYGYGVRTDMKNVFADVEINIVSEDYTEDNFDVARSVGGLIGSTNSVYLYKSGSKGNINAENALDAGGFIGYAKSTMIDQCYAKGNVTADEGVSGFISNFNDGVGIEGDKIKNSYSTGDVIIKGENAGALPYSDIFDCNCALFVTDGDDIIEHVYSSGNVIYADTEITYGKTFIGSARSKLDNTYYNGDSITYVNYNLSPVKLTPSSMLNKASYTEFDFENVWSIDEGKSTPYFKWEK